MGSHENLTAATTGDQHGVIENDSTIKQSSNGDPEFKKKKKKSKTPIEVRAVRWQALPQQRMASPEDALWYRMPIDEGLDGGSWYSLITKNLAIYSLSLKFWLIH